MSTSTPVYSDEAFEGLATEWAAVGREVERRRHAIAVRVASVWDAALPTMEAEFQQLVTQGAWQRGPEDIFTIVGLERNEVRHSAMIAWLLDPLGRHGLGSALLQGVLDECFPSEQRSVRGTTTVACEVARGDTRVDTIVWSRDFTLVIENKVDASEGYRQCDRIYRHFSDEPGALFLFVTPRGRPPKTATGDAAEAFASLSLRRIRTMLDTIVASQPKDGGVAEASVLSYLRTMQREFP